MEDYYNAGGGCFAGNCLVKLANGELKKVQDVRQGDQIKNDEGYINTVQISVKIINPKKYLEMVILADSGLQITPKHPIQVEGKWLKPY